MPAAGTPAPGRKRSVSEIRQRVLGSLVLLALATASADDSADCASFDLVGDGIPQPLGERVGNPAAGRQVAADRQRGDCSICHQLPLPHARFHGNVGPDLSAIGARLTPAQLRLRVAANRHLNPESVMPDYGLSRGRHDVATAFEDRPILTDQEIEDVVAWLSTLDGSGP